VLQPSAQEETDEERPPWHWAGLGTVAIFIVWLPLAGLASALLRRALEGSSADAAPRSIQVPMVALHIAAFCAAGAAGGLLVGRFGGRAGLREATASGVIAAALAWTLAISQGALAGGLGWAILLLVMATLGGAAAHAGGRAGLHRRPRA
jgi:tRNA-(ms[2]io[6]A)-hydroxylase